jgi:hypothetical protein
MKIHLEFNDDEPELAMRAIHGSAAFSALWDMDATLRHFLKHGDDRFKTAQDLAEYMRGEILDVLAKIEE